MGGKWHKKMPLHATSLHSVRSYTVCVCACQQGAALLQTIHHVLKQQTRIASAAAVYTWGQENTFQGHKAFTPR